jgi:hypothetical protein
MLEDTFVEIFNIIMMEYTTEYATSKRTAAYHLKKLGLKASYYQ